MGSGPACPPSATASADLASDLRLNGKLLEPPRFHTVDWQKNQIFDADDDPDRTREPFTPPSFVLLKDPEAQRVKTTCMDLLPLPHESCGSFAHVIYGLLDEDDCAELMDRVNEKGFTPALVNIGRGRQRLVPGAWNGQRVIGDSAELSAWFLRVLRPHLPEKLWGGWLMELNEGLRFLCCTPGQEFVMQKDANYRRPTGHPRAGDTSMVTVQIYLHDVPAENGGATTFDLGRQRGLLPCQPMAGSAPIFTQDLIHEGSLLLKGFKYTLRTEVMYSRRPPGP